MKVTPTNYTIAEYCQQLQQKTIVINREYQRSPKVWPQAARSYLIETILLGYPIPKLYLSQRTDVKSKKTIKEIVDGQQRSQAVLDFFKDELRISGKGKYAGKKFGTLEEPEQQTFLNYSLSADLFVGATAAEIRETFRRINSYNVPLNPQEMRHASYQGEFKWFVSEMCELYSQPLVDLGVYKEQQIARMKDGSLVSEICYALIHGIESASESKLNALYKTKDDSFTEEKELRKRLETSFNFILEHDDLHNGPLMRPYLFYSLVLAITHVRKPAEALMALYDPADASLKSEWALTNLTSLAETLEETEPDSFPEFVEACSKATNRETPRRTRFRWLARAFESAELS